MAKGISIDMRITDTDLFKDIIALLGELAESDPTISDRLRKICEKHNERV